MSESERIADLLYRVYETDAWHGPSVKEILNGITAEQAAAKPSYATHTIWQMVLHIAYWNKIVLRRLQGEDLRPGVDTPEDWPTIQSSDVQSWEKALDDLHQSERGLLQWIKTASDAKLAERAVGRAYTNYVMAQGVIDHIVYHSGQIALLKKALSATK